MENRSGQIGVEFMLVVALVLIIFVPLFVFLIRSGSSSTDRLAEANIDQLVTQLRDQARDTYYLGTYNKKTLTLDIPQQVTSLSVINATPKPDAASGLKAQYYLEADYNLSGQARSFRASSDVPLRAKGAACQQILNGCDASYTCLRCPIPGLRSGAQQEIELRTSGGPVNLTVV